MNKVTIAAQNVKHTLVNWSWVQWVTAGVAAFSVVMLLATGVQTYRAQQVYESTYPTNQASINQLKSQLNQLSKEPEIDPEEVVLEAKSAFNQGSTVADLQNEFYRIKANKNIDWQAKSDRLMGLSMELSDYFEADSQAGTSSWITMSGTYTTPPLWKFVTTMTSTADEFDVLWLCTDGDAEKLVAYCTGKFNPDSNNGKGLFFDIKPVVTTYGRNTYTQTVAPDTDPYCDPSVQPVTPPGVNITPGETSDDGTFTDNVNYTPGGVDNVFSEDLQESINKRGEVFKGQTPSEPAESEAGN